MGDTEEFSARTQRKETPVPGWEAKRFMALGSGVRVYNFRCVLLNVETHAYRVAAHQIGQW